MLLVLQGVTLRYPRAPRPVLQEVSLSLAAGEFVFLTGASGSGKTSLLRLIYGAARPREGTILFQGKPVAQYGLHRLRRSLGVVFQENRLLAHQTVLENVAFAAEVLGDAPGAARRRAAHLVERVGLAHRAHSLPFRLSSGERQRVAIARALMNRPALLVADEPTGNLDPANARAVMDEFVALTREAGTACLMATHAIHLVEEYPFRVLHLRDGRLGGVGS